MVSYIRDLTMRGAPKKTDRSAFRGYHGSRHLAIRERSEAGSLRAAGAAMGLPDRREGPVVPNVGRDMLREA